MTLATETTIAASATHSEPAAGLAGKLSALVARSARPGPVGPDEAVAAVVPAVAELTAELRDDLLTELGDLRAEVAAVGDEATEATGRLRARTDEIAASWNEQAVLAAERSERLERHLDVLTDRLDGFALDLAAAVRHESQRLEASLHSAIEDAALVLAETLLFPASCAEVPAPAEEPTPAPAASPAASPVAAVVPAQARNDDRKGLFGRRR